MPCCVPNQVGQQGRGTRQTGDKKIGDGGHRSPYLSHAKRALYHLSYVPVADGHPGIPGLADRMTFPGHTKNKNIFSKSK
eukprot:353930-Chlamydomonas_euryale.AAC.5